MFVEIAQSAVSRFGGNAGDVEVVQPWGRTFNAKVGFIPCAF